MVTDPALKWGVFNTGTCRWSAIEGAPESEVMRRAKTHGIGFGFTFSQDGTVFNGSRGDREFTDDEIARISDLVVRLHNLTKDLNALGDQLHHELRSHSIAVTHG